MTRGREDKRARRLSEWLVLLSIMTLQTHAIETVNVADFCGQTVQGDGMIVRSHKESRKYYFVTMGTDCHLTMQSATPRDKVQFHFRFFLVYSLLRVSPFSSVPLFAESAKGPAPPGPAPPGPAPPGPAPPGPTWPELRLEPTPGEDQGDPCHTGSYIQFYDGRDKTAPPIGPPLCGKSLPRPVLSTGNYLTLRLVTRGTQPRVDFVGDFTSFRLGFNQSECRGEPYFHCHNGKCIPMSLVCNDDKGIDNCGDGTDLQDYPGCISVSSTASAPRSRAAPPVVLPNTPTLTASTPEKCSGLSDIPNLDSVNDSQPPASLLVLYVLLGVGAGTVLLCWCCWSPGWFVWRVSVCRFLHCCNSCCASCQLCGRSCTQTKEHRLTKVTPQVMPQGTTPPAPTATTMAV